MPTPSLIRSAAVLQVRDVVKSARFYVEKLGFSAGGFWGDPPCFCIVGRGTITIFLDEAREGDVPHNQYWAAYLYVDDVEAALAEFTASGVEIVRGIEDMPYGCREFDIRDLDGHLIGIGQDLDPKPEGPGL